jgi:hypothetical protein
MNMGEDTPPEGGEKAWGAYGVAAQGVLTTSLPPNVVRLPTCARVATLSNTPSIDQTHSARIRSMDEWRAYKSLDAAVKQFLRQSRASWFCRSGPNEGYYIKQITGRELKMFIGDLQEASLLPIVCTNERYKQALAESMDRVLRQFGIPDGKVRIVDQPASDEETAMAVTVPVAKYNKLRLSATSLPLGNPPKNDGQTR